MWLFTVTKEDKRMEPAALDVKLLSTMKDEHIFKTIFIGFDEMSNGASRPRLQDEHKFTIFIGIRWTQISNGQSVTNCSDYY